MNYYFDTQTGVKASARINKAMKVSFVYGDGDDDDDADSNNKRYSAAGLRNNSTHTPHIACVVCVCVVVCSNNI